MSGKKLAIWMILVGLAIALSAWIAPARAQEPTPENDANCVACHTHRYYLYDSGKWFCLCDAPMHCVYCHGGRTDSEIEEVAHEGLVLYPTLEHAVRCQACHPADYMDRVVTFASVAGISSTAQPIITATPVGAAVPITAQPFLSPLRLSELEPWRLAGLGVLTIMLIGVVIFGYRCYKADCLGKLRN
jgi:hypothetical protein